MHGATIKIIKLESCICRNNPKFKSVTNFCAKLTRFWVVECADKLALQFYFFFDTQNDAESRDTRCLKTLMATGSFAGQFMQGLQKDLVIMSVWQQDVLNVSNSEYTYFVSKPYLTRFLYCQVTSALSWIYIYIQGDSKTVEHVRQFIIQ